MSQVAKRNAFTDQFQRRQSQTYPQERHCALELLTSPVPPGLQETVLIELSMMCFDDDKHFLKDVKTNL